MVWYCAVCAHIWLVWADLCCDAMMACTRWAVCSLLLEKTVQWMRRWLHCGCSGSGLLFDRLGARWLVRVWEAKLPPSDRIAICPLIFCWLKMMARYTAGTNGLVPQSVSISVQTKHRTRARSFSALLRGDPAVYGSAHLITSSSDKRRAAQVRSPRPCCNFIPQNKERKPWSEIIRRPRGWSVTVCAAPHHSSRVGLVGEDVLVLAPVVGGSN
jgi:hypothetical protein